jgi:DNA-binding transcriptional LysR family regulator
MRDLNALGLFAMVVEAKSFSAAARRLTMPVSTVSRRIAELEDQLGVRLLDRSTRNLRVTEVGAEVLEHARHSAELCEAVDNIVSNSVAEVAGPLRICTPPSISDSLILPVVSAFQASYPNVRVQVRSTERIVTYIEEDVDLAFKVGAFLDPDLVSRTLLTYRHQVVASPLYLGQCDPPREPRALLGHRILAFSFWQPHYSWSFLHANQRERETIAFTPCVAMNDYSALVVALLTGAGIGELPPIVQPDLLRKGLLIELMPEWHLPIFYLTIAHARSRHLPRQVRVFKEFASQMVPTMFPTLPV